MLLAKIELSNRMERAAKSLMSLRAAAGITSEDLARAAWPAAVGGKIAGHTRAASLVRQRLVVEVEDVVWQKQLYQLRFQILPKLKQLLGEGVVEELEFRVGIPRRPPQSAAALSDEADRIEDAVFRRLYKQARKKAPA